MVLIAITQKVLMQRLLTRHTNKTSKADNIDYNKNPASTLKEEYFKKTYEIPLHDVKNLLVVSLHEAKNYKKGNGSTNFNFTRVLPYFRFVGRDTLLFSHNERPFLTYPDRQGMQDGRKIDYNKNTASTLKDEYF